MKRYAITGLVIWAAATIALRFAGQHVMRNPLILLAISLPVMIYVAMAIVGHAQDRARAAIAVVAPGMLLDTISAIWFVHIFPNIDPSAAGVFGGWLLFCNVVVLLTAVTYAPRRTQPHSASEHAT